MTQIGSCGKRLEWYCTPEIEDDLCVSCPFNARNCDIELEEDD